MDKVKFYRVEHKSIISDKNKWYIGSWYACWKESKTFDNSFKNKLYYLYNKIEDPTLERFRLTPASKLPVSWKSPTVGPARDPYLREWYFNHYVKNQNYIFGTNSIEQMKPWINKEIIELLDEKGFVLRIYKSRHIINGFRQSVMAIDKPYIKLKEFKLKGII